ncbi:hypothetical protein SNE40_012146 [Patella caerulea]|uniref:Gamma-tubulin complex component n=2 Tax=Patella caerulea TaxID=87958 RepID=A0AAN8PMT1_PATCE
MYHEILLALSGNTGGIFRDKGDGIKVIADLPFINPSEISILNELGKLGTYYKHFQQFITKYSNALSVHHRTLKSEEDLHGLYLKAACHGIDIVLQDYRQSLLSLEKDFIQDPYLPVSHLLCTLKEYELLFPELSAVTEQIKSHKAHGCYILDIVQKRSICGLPVVKQAFKRILHVCHNVFYKQLCAWLLHGTLVDSYNEFIIQKIDENSQTLTVSKTEQEEDDLGIMGITGRQMQKAMTISTPKYVQPKEHLYGIQANLLPAYIPIRVASKILFVGESVQMFENEKQNSKNIVSDPILRSRVEEFTKDLHELSKQEEFNLMAFDKIIDKIRTFVAERLWLLIVEESDLRNQLKIIKDFFLLGRGELYLAFIDQAQHLLSGPATSTTQHDINMAFQQAARNVLLQNESLLQKFQLTITRKSGSGPTGSAVETGWNCLGLQHTIHWPLHIFFTSAMLEKYNRIFKFLLAIKRAQLDIQSCWTIQMIHKQKPSHQEEMAKWQLRTHMGFLVDNLQYYLQVDVIESQYGILLDKINSTRDFEAVKVAHENFLSALLAQSFVHMKSVSHCLREILDLCTAYSRLMTTSDIQLLPQQLQQLTDIAQKFQRQFNLLFKILSSVKHHNASPYLAQLLLRLDYNKYFTSTGGQIGI